jgi:hypothetical protein
MTDRNSDSANSGRMPWKSILAVLSVTKFSDWLASQAAPSEQPDGTVSRPSLTARVLQAAVKAGGAKAVTAILSQAKNRNRRNSAIRTALGVPGHSAPAVGSGSGAKSAGSKSPSGQMVTHSQPRPMSGAKAATRPSAAMQAAAGAVDGLLSTLGGGASPEQIPAIRDQISSVIDTLEAAQRSADEDDTPTVYHGTNAPEFNKFDINEAKLGVMGRGFYFTSDPEEARSFGERVIPAKIRMRKPWTIDDPLTPAARNAMREGYKSHIGADINEPTPKLFNRNGDAFKETKRQNAAQALSNPKSTGYDVSSALEHAFGDYTTQNILKAAGFDGQTMDAGDGKKWLVAFDPDQIEMQTPPAKPSDGAKPSWQGMSDAADALVPNDPTPNQQPVVGTRPAQPLPEVRPLPPAPSDGAKPPWQGMSDAADALVPNNPTTRQTTRQEVVGSIPAKQPPSLWQRMRQFGRPSTSPLHHDGTGPTPAMASRIGTVNSAHVVADQVQARNTPPAAESPAVQVMRRTAARFLGPVASRAMGLGQTTTGATGTTTGATGTTTGATGTTTGATGTTTGATGTTTGATGTTTGATGTTTGATGIPDAVRQASIAALRKFGYPAGEADARVSAAATSLAGKPMDEASVIRAAIRGPAPSPTATASSTQNGAGTASVPPAASAGSRSSSSATVNQQGGVSGSGGGNGNKPPTGPPIDSGDDGDDEQPQRRKHNRRRNHTASSGRRGHARPWLSENAIRLIPKRFHHLARQINAIPRPSRAVQVMARRRTRQAFGAAAKTRVGGAAMKMAGRVLPMAGRVLASPVGGAMLAGAGTAGLLTGGLALGVAFTAISVLLTGMVASALRSFVNRINEGNRGLAQYNGQIAVAFARLDYNRIRREIERGRHTSASSTFLTRQLDQLEESLEPLSTIFANVTNYPAGAAAWLGSAIMSPVNGIIGGGGALASGAADGWLATQRLIAESLMSLLGMSEEQIAEERKHQEELRKIEENTRKADSAGLGIQVLQRLENPNYQNMGPAIPQGPMPPLWQHNP